MLAQLLKSLFETASVSTLDPLTTIIRLYTLHFRPEETKLSFENFSVVFDYPKKIFDDLIQLQGANRTMKRSSGKDLTMLKIVIEDFVKTYNMRNKQIKYFVNGCILGLKRLQKCYDKNLAGKPVAHSIELYIKILEGATLDEDEEIKDCGFFNPVTALNDKVVSSAKFVWTVSQIKLVYATLKELTNQLDEGNKAKVVETDYLLTVVDKMLEIRDHKLEEFTTKGENTENKTVEKDVDDDVL